MKDWQQFWATFPNTVGETEYLKQVGHTIAGQPYTETQFESMITSICQGLAIGPDDVVLDLCCGKWCHYCRTRETMYCCGWR